VKRWKCEPLIVCKSAIAIRKVVKAIVENELDAAGETWDSFNTYMRVKQKVQNDQISIVRAAEEAESLAKNYLGAAGFGGA